MGFLAMWRGSVGYAMPRSSATSNGVPQTRQITAEQSPHVSGSFTSRAQFGQYSVGALGFFCGVSGV